MSLAPTIRLARSSAQRAQSLLRSIQYNHPPSCPCHSNPGHHANPFFGSTRRQLATPIDHSRQKEYAFEMAASAIRFGPGCTKEVGMDFKNMGAKKVCVVTDQNVSKLDAMKQVIEGLTREGVEYTIYDKVRVEPKDSSYVCPFLDMHRQVLTLSQNTRGHRFRQTLRTRRLPRCWWWLCH